MSKTKCRLLNLNSKAGLLTKNFVHQKRTFIKCPRLKISNRTSWIHMKITSFAFHISKQTYPIAAPSVSHNVTFKTSILCSNSRILACEQLLKM